MLNILRVGAKEGYRNMGLTMKLTLSRANCGPLNAVRGLLSSVGVPFSLGGFFGRLVRGPAFKKK